MSTADHDAAEEFGPYLVYERLGMGGMATVHRAKKRGIAGFERGVALKRLLPHLAEDKEFIESFVREAKLASLLVHPNIAQIYDLGRVGSAYYIAMEHVEGIDVRKILRYARRSGEVIPLTVALQIIAELCDALEYAHTYVDELGEHLGIVHRDVSPSNLIVSNSGHLKVIDFGIAKATTKQHNTESGRIKGKLGYLSPEASLGKSYGPPSDVFSAGVVAFELLTTHPLFWAKNDYETLQKIHHAEVPPPSRINPAVPPDLDKVILDALERSASDRTQSAAELRIGIDRMVSRYGFRLSSREVFDWLSGVSSESWATLKPAPRSLSQQQAAAAAAQLRPLPLPPPPEPQLSSRTTNSGRSTSIAHAAALAEAGHTLGAGGVLAPLARTAEDDLIAEVAWGTDGQSYPLLPEMMSGMSGKLAPLSSSSSSLLLPQGMLRRWALPMGVVTILVAAVGGALLMRSSKASPELPRPPAVAPSPALVTLTFAVQPSDAVIEIGIDGLQPDAVNQVKLAPGMYSVVIRREGYAPWNKDVTVRAGEDQSIQVALQPEKPDSQGQPDSQEGMVAANDPTSSAEDGTGRPGGPAGTGSVARSDDLSEESPRRPDDRLPPRDRTSAPARPTVRRAVRGVGSVEVLDAGPVPGSGSAEGSGGSGSASHVPSSAGSASGSAEGSAATRGNPTAAVGAIDQAARTATEPPVAPAKLPPAVTPSVPVVSASLVTKLSGSIPNLRASGRSKELSDNVVAKLCIDERGGVTSVQMVRAAAEISAEVQSSLRSWRYKPYLDDGKPSPVCFALSMRVVVVSSN